VPALRSTGSRSDACRGERSRMGDEKMKNKKLQSGFTLAEMLVVLAIIAIMATAVFVIVKPAEDKGKIELTKATIELLCAALEQYHNFYNEFPDPNRTINATEYYGGSHDDPNKAERMSYRLSLCPDAVAILNQINPKMVKNTDKNADDIVEYIDAWGMEFWYEYSKPEKWNFPRITSAGPDRKFLTDDDITSKK
jgi:prepilin-type N-terminal cleavage/methylation domain-containing protein